MSKMALVVNTEDYLNVLKERFNGALGTDRDIGENKYINNHGGDILKLTPTLVSREICETDPTTLQVIPYITLVSLIDPGESEPEVDVSPTNPKAKFFIYTRGEKGNEGRLHGKCSLGLGGHIEEAPTEELSFDHVIGQCLYRELIEEVGLEIASFNTPRNVADHGELFLDQTNDVGRVHIALSFTLFVSPLDLNETEDGVITKGQWLTFNEINDLMKSEEDPLILEEWSMMYFQSHGLI